jgi:hypothetical protein
MEVYNYDCPRAQRQFPGPNRKEEGPWYASPKAVVAAIPTQLWSVRSAAPASPARGPGPRARMVIWDPRNILYLDSYNLDIYSHNVMTQDDRYDNIFMRISRGAQELFLGRPNPRGAGRTYPHPRGDRRASVQRAQGGEPHALAAEPGPAHVNFINRAHC